MYVKCPFFKFSIFDLRFLNKFSISCLFVISFYVDQVSGPFSEFELVWTQAKRVDEGRVPKFEEVVIEYIDDELSWFWKLVEHGDNKITGK